MNRRQFIKRISVLVGALIAGAGDFLRGGTSETPVSWGNRSAPLLESRGDAAHHLAVDLHDGESVTDRLDQFGKACAELRPELAETCAGASWSVEEEVSRIIVSNPEMSREDAFFQAVIERAESRL